MAKNVVSVAREQAEEKCQKLKNEVDEMHSESFVLQSSVLRESELTEQLESCACSQMSKAQEKRRLSNRQLEEVKVECQEPLNAMTVQDSPGVWNPYSRNKCGEKCSHFLSRQAACPKQVMTHAFKEKG